MIEVVWRGIGRVWSEVGESVLIDAPLAPIAGAEWWRFEFYGGFNNVGSPKRIKVVLGSDPSAGAPGVTLLDYGPMNAGELAYQVLSVVANQGGGVFFAANQLNLGGTVAGVTKNFVFNSAEIVNFNIKLIAESTTKDDVVNGIFIARKEWQA